MAVEYNQEIRLADWSREPIVGIATVVVLRVFDILFDDPRRRIGWKHSSFALDFRVETHDSAISDCYPGLKSGRRFEPDPGEPAVSNLEEIPTLIRLTLFLSNWLLCL